MTEWLQFRIQDRPPLIRIMQYTCIGEGSVRWATLSSNTNTCIFKIDSHRLLSWNFALTQSVKFVQRYQSQLALIMHMTRNKFSIYSALWVMQSTTGLRPMDCINKSGLIKGSEVFWLILQSQIVIRLDYTNLNPAMLCYMVQIP